MLYDLTKMIGENNNGVGFKGKCIFSSLFFKGCWSEIMNIGERMVVDCFFTEKGGYLSATEIWKRSNKYPENKYRTTKSTIVLVIIMQLTHWLLV